jgi:hypothetical protein
MRAAASFIAASVALAALPLALAAYQDGPVPGVTGGFGEPTCRQCHAGDAATVGSLKIEAPATYLPGRAYDVRVTLERPGLQVGGFEVSARYLSGALAGTQAGSLEAVDERTRVITSRKIQYAQHTAAGSTSTKRGALQWSLTWRAPKSPRGQVVFHVAGNASNADYSALGDSIYTSEFVSRVR